ncbi:5'-3' exoribonuclease 4-like isoform X2 [Lactuca sativa]|uniref:5'-3' exoribonuclease 4-like isoform X2 n=1 Tax=Lactuca sativa TaxID=4236 RepID=UPI001C693985|nr:5'-3' exoribonuclease 4-like isoform X2 [Lactuca sativa]XP_052625470.1 5'-3' exoribonuclease 4-like isoform X2 [Lactuca sativa]
MWSIDVYASCGMNGYLWLCERNGFRMVLPTLINGLGDIMNNHVINVTYINPTPHKHIPEPPKGVVMPKKVLQETVARRRRDCTAPHVYVVM